MKKPGNKLYFLLLAVFLLLVFLFEYYTPVKFEWRPTFGKYDKQPFGSYVFDDVMSSSVEGYQVVNKTFYQLYMESPDATPEEEYPRFDGEEEQAEEFEEKAEEEEIIMDEEPDTHSPFPVSIRPLPREKRRGILITEDKIPFTEVDRMALFNLLKQGHKVMLCLTSFPSLLQDSLYFSEEYKPHLYYRAMQQYAKKGHRRDSLFFGVDSLHPEQVYEVYPHLHPVCLKEGRTRHLWQEERDSVLQTRIRCDSMEILVRDKQGGAKVMRLRIGEGELFLVSTPLMFTNYGLLDGSNASYAFRLLSYMEGVPVMRLESYGITGASNSQLRYLLSRPPLQWALYAALFTLLLFMFFAAKRRQWVIPVVRPPANETLRFTQLIGNLYYQKKDYKDLLSRKYHYFHTEVKRLNGLDLQSGEPDGELGRRLAEKTGQDPHEVWPAFRELKYLLREDSPADEAAMLRSIDRMNEWRRLMIN
jgi:hypothetical protein